MSVAYRCENLTVRYGEREALKSVTSDIRSGELTALVGPNGAGKSTWVATLAGVLDHYEGRCEFDGKSLSEWPKRKLARRAAYVPQSVRLEFPFTAEQVVFMGRTPHCDGLFETEHDRDAVRRAMNLTDSAQFAERSFGALSGGERQRVILASALAQEPRALLLDEPGTYLDLKHQLALYALLRDVAREGKAVVAVTHDLNLAATFADRVIALHDGRIAADGPADEVIREDTIRDVFDAAVAVRETAAGRPWMSYE